MIQTQNSSSCYKTILLSIIIACFFIHVKSVEWYQKGSPHFIDQSQFNKLVINPETRTSNPVMIKYFTPWCRYCRFLKEIVDKILKEGQWALEIYEINCDGANHNFCGKMKVRSFPRVQIYLNGQQKESLEGFYPHPVIKDLFVKYDKIAQISKEKGKEPKQLQKAEKKEDQTVNYIDPVVVPVEVSKEQKQQQKVVVETDTTVQAVVVEPVTVETTPLETVNPQPTPQPTPSPSRKSDQVLNQEQNIVEVDQDVKQAQNQKKILEEVIKKDQQAKQASRTLASDVEPEATSYLMSIFYIVSAVGGCFLFYSLVCSEDKQQESSSQKMLSSNGTKRGSIARFGSNTRSGSDQNNSRQSQNQGKRNRSMNNNGGFDHRYSHVSNNIQIYDQELNEEHPCSDQQEKMHYNIADQDL